MATIIAEPADLPVGAITDETARYYRILVYQMAQDDAGIKTLSLADWKTYLGFNNNKVDNVATYVGIDVDEYNYKSENLEPLPQGVISIVNRIENLADNTGASTEHQTGIIPTNTRVGTLENKTALLEGQVQTGWDDTSGGTTVHYDGLLNRVSDLESTVGPGGGGGDSISQRVGVLESQVQTTTTGLLDRTSTIENEIGTYDNTDGTIEERLEYLKTNVGNDGSDGEPKTGLIKQTEDLETKTGCGSSYTDTNSLLNRVATLEGNSGVGLIPNNPSNPYDTTKGTLLKRIEDVESAASAGYTYKGNITAVNNDVSTGDTISIVVNNDSEHPIYIADMTSADAGNLYNCDNSFTFKKDDDTFTVVSGDNVAVVYTTSAWFNKLGTTINTQELEAKINKNANDIQTLGGDLSSIGSDVETLEGKFKNATVTGSDVWQSTSLTKGVYLISVVRNASLSTDVMLETFVAYIADDDGHCYIKNKLAVASSGSNIDFNDSGMGATYIITVSSTNCVVQVTQIGNSMS